MTPSPPCSATASSRSADEIDAVGFKTVLGKDLSGCVIADQQVIDALEGFTAVAPAHNPPYAAGIRQFAQIAAQGPPGGAVRDGVLSMDERRPPPPTPCPVAGGTSASGATASTAPATSSSPSAPPSCADARTSRASPAASIWMARNPSRARRCAWFPATSAAPVPSPASATAWPSAPAWASRRRADCRKTTASATSIPAPSPMPCARSASPWTKPNAS